MRKTVRVLLCMVWLMLCAALPAFGAESAPHVTAETTMAQLRANPAIQGSGYYTYCREMTPLMVERWKNKTLHDYFGDTDRESGIAALNLIIDNYNKGVKVTYQVYTPEEIEHNSSLGCVQLFYYPAETPNAKDLLSSPEIENILENSDFIYMLNQAAGDRKILAERLNISSEQLAYVTNSEPGHGLLFFNNVILPFADDFPKDTELYKLLTTKPSEVEHETMNK